MEKPILSKICFHGFFIEEIPCWKVFIMICEWFFRHFQKSNDFPLNNFLKRQLFDTLFDFIEEIIDKNEKKKYCHVKVLWVKSIRSGQWWCSVKKGVLKTSANFTGKHLRWNLFLIVLRPATLVRLQHRCFPVFQLLRTLF